MASILFVDLRGFTPLAERTPAREVVALLNDFYDLIIPLLREHGGHPNKLMGDGLLAVFGAPDRRSDHGSRAIQAALAIAAGVRARYGDELRAGIGVDSGAVVVGTIGGGGRLDFTVIGDTVNTAVRVEAATRQTGDDILATEATLRLAGVPSGSWQERHAVTLKGKQQLVQCSRRPRYGMRASARSARGTGDRAACDRRVRSHGLRGGAAGVRAQPRPASASDESSSCERPTAPAVDPLGEPIWGSPWGSGQRS